MYDSCNISLPTETVYGIHVLNEGNRIEFLLAYFYRVLKWGALYFRVNWGIFHSGICRTQSRV